MRKTREEKAITLIALIITIVVLLILAVVAINAVTGDGIIQHAVNAKEEYENAQDAESDMLEMYLNKLDSSEAIPMEKAQGRVLSLASTTKVVDEFGNIIKVPAGFMITEDADNVTEGIVIEDVSAGTETKGSQFVWIPVGKVYKNIEKEYVTITLGRYGNFNEPYNPAQPTSTNTYKSEKRINYNNYEFFESQPSEEMLGNNGNAIAKNINDFYERAIFNNGYYIGRYEARKSDTSDKVTCIGTSSIYNDISQVDAAVKCQAMYQENNFESDMVNSYAWDTAIVFIQMFSNNKNYSNQSSLNNSFASRGTNNLSTEAEKDIECNIWDMASNCFEWSTEATTNQEYPCAARGSFYGYYGDSSKVSAFRLTCVSSQGDERFTFRTILYL